MGGASESAGDRRKRRRREREFKKHYARGRGESDSTQRSYSIWRRRLPYACFGLAVTVGAVHLAAYAGAIGVRPTGLQDILIGYPTALLLAVAGGILLPAQRS
jgi:hypothetical protein